MNSLSSRLFVSLFFAILCACASTGKAASISIQGFPSEFKLAELWEKLVIDGKPTRAYRFVTNESINEVTQKIAQWLMLPKIPAIERRINGWIYLSHRKEETWVTVQVRQINSGSASIVEGVVSFWQDSPQLAASTQEPKLPTLDGMKILRRLVSVDRGRNALTITAIGDASVDSVAKSLAFDMKTLGYAPASYAPPLLLSEDKATNRYGAISRAWIGNGKQALFSVFNHDGKTAVQIYLLGGKQLE